MTRRTRGNLLARELGVLTLSDSHDDGPAVRPGLVTTTVITAPAFSLRRSSVFRLTLSDLATALNAFFAQPPPLQLALNLAPAGTWRTSKEVNVVVDDVRVNA